MHGDTSAKARVPAYIIGGSSFVVYSGSDSLPLGRLRRAYPVDSTKTHVLVPGLRDWNSVVQEIWSNSPRYTVTVGKDRVRQTPKQ